MKNKVTILVFLLIVFIVLVFDFDKNFIIASIPFTLLFLSLDGSGEGGGSI